MLPDCPASAAADINPSDLQGGAFLSKARPSSDPRGSERHPSRHEQIFLVFLSYGTQAIRTPALRCPVLPFLLARFHLEIVRQKLR